jgi:hypothetical protein
VHAPQPFEPVPPAEALTPCAENVLKSLARSLLPQYGHCTTSDGDMTSRSHFCPHVLHLYSNTGTDYHVLS